MIRRTRPMQDTGSPLHGPQMKPHRGTAGTGTFARLACGEATHF